MELSSFVPLVILQYPRYLLIVYTPPLKLIYIKLLELPASSCPSTRARFIHQRSTVETKVRTPVVRMSALSPMFCQPPICVFNSIPLAVTPAILALCTYVREVVSAAPSSLVENEVDVRVFTR